jgi:Protein of unknown function (DUF2806).
MSSESKPTDLLGLAPYGEAVKSATDKTFETAQAFLYALCRPAAEEAGLLFRDQIRFWRAKNLARIAEKAQAFTTVTPEGLQLQAPPRVVHEIIEHGSWCEQEELQSMWAGLLASSCTKDGVDDSSLPFIDILKRITSAEAKLIEHVCKNSIVDASPSGVLRGRSVDLSLEQIQAITGWKDKTLAQACIEHLVSLGLLKEQPAIFFNGTPKVPWIQPEPLTLHFYVRCCGSRIATKQFFDELASKTGKTAFSEAE